MNIVRAILLGSAAGLSMMTGAEAADLPMTKAAPVEYVRVCTAYGPGFFYIPGTDTCIKVGGRARFEYQYSGPLKSVNSDASSYRGLGRLQVDARTASEWGTVRTFVRFEIASRTGGWPLRSGTAERQAQAFFATGIDTFSRAQKYVEADKAFIQFAGLTAGRFSSFYDFYGHELEFIGYTFSSEVQSTNGIAYTAKLGNGFSATLSVEDPTARRQPLYTAGGIFPNNAAANSAVPSGLRNLPYNGTTFPGAIGLTFDPSTGLPTSYASVDIAQRNQLPDFVGVLRYDGGWGSAQLSAATHQISVGTFVQANQGSTVLTPTQVAALGGVQRPEAAYGYAVQAGVKFKLDMIAPGDQLWLQAAYGKGALSYTGITGLCGGANRTCQSWGRFNVDTFDGYLNAYGDIKLTESWSVVASYLHYWTPTVRQAVFASYAGVDFGKGARGALGPLYAGLGGSLIPANLNFTPAQAIAYAYSPSLKNYNMFYVGTNLVWSPVKNLDIGAEVSYAQKNVSGRVVDVNKPLTYTINGVPTPKTTSMDYVWETRLRIQRDF
ncbi:porin [Chelatococcus reniformis]|uniref:Porin n=1 Tax=Chelatococcus reniformis TaxID=1494448 RepID=A0A916XE34_9HYPH|nr:porin [Chelatococcus reniformis]GGC66864.1 polymerase [Chelatococcus reniformis]